jgi:hypothetical protein
VINVYKTQGMSYALGLAFGVEVVSHFRKPQQDNQLPLTRKPLPGIAQQLDSTLDH